MVGFEHLLAVLEKAGSGNGYALGRRFGGIVGSEKLRSCLWGSTRSDLTMSTLIT